jgi:four helix bundle protein
MVTQWGQWECRLLDMKDDSVDEALREWEGRQREAIVGDPAWRLNCYREAMFLIDRVREDVREFGALGTYTAAKEQLLTSVGSIAANIAEGYGRPSPADRLRFLTYALGSTREAVAWYQVLRPSVDHAAVDDRIDRLSRIRRMLLGLLGRFRGRSGRKFEAW